MTYQDVCWKTASICSEDLARELGGFLHNPVTVIIQRVVLLGTVFMSFPGALPSVLFEIKISLLNVSVLIRVGSLLRRKAPSFHSSALYLSLGGEICKNYFGILKTFS